MHWITAVSPHRLVAGVVVVLWVERRDLASIGITRPSRRDLALNVVGFVLGLASFMTTEPLVQAFGFHHTERGTRSLIILFPMWMLAVITFTATVTEEILYRGYPIERLEELTGSIWTGAIATYVMFLAIHLPLRGWCDDSDHWVDTCRHRTLPVHPKPCRVYDMLGT